MKREGGKEGGKGVESEWGEEGMEEGKGGMNVKSCVREEEEEGKERRRNEGRKKRGGKGVR